MHEATDLTYNVIRPFTQILTSIFLTGRLIDKMKGPF